MALTLEKVERQSSRGMTDRDLPRRLPRSYLMWLTGFTVSRFGDAVLTFALGWAASGLGGTTAAMVLTASALPRVLLLVVGGAVADRIGARRVLIAGEAVLLALTAALAVALSRFGTPAWLLVASSLALGAVAAFCLPASGSQPRRLVPDDQLSRALALRQGLAQVVQLTAAPLGGLLVGAVGLPAIAWGDVLALGIGFCVLVAVRDMVGSTAAAVPDSPRRSRMSDVLDGVRVVARTPALRVALLLTGAAAALMLPVPALVIPLLGREQGWGPGATGVIAGSVGAGVVCASFVIARRAGRPSRAGGVGSTRAASGLVLSGAGATVLGVGPLLVDARAGIVLAVCGGLAFGCGNGAVVARLAPLVLGSAPRTHLARVQAVVGLVQLVPVMAANVVLGAVAQLSSPTWALSLTASALAACAAWARRAIDVDDARAVRDTGRVERPVALGERSAP